MLVIVANTLSRNFQCDALLGTDLSQRMLQLRGSNHKIINALRRAAIKLISEFHYRCITTGFYLLQNIIDHCCNTGIAYRFPREQLIQTLIKIALACIQTGDDRFRHGILF